MKIILLSLFLSLSSSLFSQELLFYASGGLSGHKYKSDLVNNRIKLGGNLGISYTYYLSDKMGINTGLEFGLYRNNLGFKHEYNHTTNILDDTGENFEYRVQTEGYTLSSYFTALAIPLMWQYRLGKKHNFYINSGLKLVIPQKIDVNVNADKVNLSGYYANDDLLVDDLPQHGFGTIANWSDNLNIEQKLTATLSLETGMYFNIKENSLLYAGIFFDYGLSNMLKENSAEQTDNKALIKYNPTNIQDAKFNGMTGTGIKKANLLAFGINVKYTLKFQKKQKNKYDTETILENKTIEPAKETSIDVSKEADKEVKISVKEGTKKEPKGDTKVSEQTTDRNNKVVTIENNSYDDNSDKKVKTATEKIEETKISLEGNESGSTKLSEQAKKNLDEVVKIMKKNKNIKLKIIGHTCNIGSIQENYRVGMKRANSTYKYLIDKGISHDRLQVISKGETQPLAPNTKESNRQKNRRVELEVIF